MSIEPSIIIERKYILIFYLTFQGPPGCKVETAVLRCLSYELRDKLTTFLPSYELLCKEKWVVMSLKG